MISGIYNNYLSNYGNKQVSKYDTHKKSELRYIYNKIISKRKTAPLYKVDLNEDVQKYVVNLKENARILKNTVEEFSSESDLSGLNKKVAFSDNEHLVSASFVNSGKETSASKEIFIEVLNLAKPQVNVGNMVTPNEKGLSPGAYSFDLNIEDNEYEFQYSVSPEDTNFSVQEKLVRLINKANIGLNAQIIADKNNLTSLKIKSDSTGIKNYNPLTFSITESSDEMFSGSVEFFGLNNVYEKPENARFSVNGVENFSVSNNFTINKTFDITLNNLSEAGETAKIGFKDDVDAILDNAATLIEKFNSVVSLANSNDSLTGNVNRLIKDVSSITSKHRNSLESNGFTINNDNFVSIDKSLFIQTVNEGRLNEAIESLESFKNDLGKKATQISIDPMEYVNKKLIIYSNPNNKINNNPYITSIYTGMMYNNYI